MAPQTKKGNTGQMIWYQGRERKQVMIQVILGKGKGLVRQCS